MGNICFANFQVSHNYGVSLSYYWNGVVVPRIAVGWDLGGPISSGYFSPLLTPLFHKHCVVFLMSYIYTISDVTRTFLARLFINPEFCQVF